MTGAHAPLLKGRTERCRRRARLGAHQQAAREAVQAMHRRGAVKRTLCRAQTSGCHQSRAASPMATSRQPQSV